MEWWQIGLLVLAGGGAFFMAFNNGANDVANSFASAVGAKAITIKQAVIVAGLMNLLGAVLLGGHVSAKLITGVLNPNHFGDSNSYILAMFAVLLAAGTFVLLATFYSLPVSSSHSIVGSLLGVSLVVGGTAAVNWSEVTRIVISWFLSPVLAAVIAYAMLTFVRRVILKDGGKGTMARMQYYLPFVLAITGGFFVLILLKGSTLSAYRPGSAWEYGILLGFFCPYVVIISQALLRSTTKDMADNADSADSVFRRLQVGTSSYVAFAHGANDVANAIAPVFAIYLVVTQGGLPTKELVGSQGVPMWILVLGGGGIAVGIGLLGHRVIKTLSEKITKINNTRGFCVDFSAASTVVTASLMGMPVSSTHAATGAIIGSGVADRQKVDMKVMLKIFGMWVLTVPAAGLITIVIFKVLEFIF